MSSNINKIKKKLQAVSPILQVNQLFLDDLVVSMKEKLSELDKSIADRDEVVLKRTQFISDIQSKAERTDKVDLESLQNARYYLEKIDEQIDQAAVDLAKKETDLDGLKDQLKSQQLSIKNIEKFIDKNKGSLTLEEEKISMNNLDELFLQKLHLGVKYE